MSNSTVAHNLIKGRRNYFHFLENAVRGLSLLGVVGGFCVGAVFSFSARAQSWQTVETQGQVTARHEAGLVAFANNIYLIGGRRINPVDKLDTRSLVWHAGAKSPGDLHHFQATVWKDAIVAAGAMSGGFPDEKPLSHIYFYYPKKDSWQQGPEIPVERRRGGAGSVVVGNTLYLVGGITNGHIDGYVNWFDAVNLKTGEWQVLADAPHKRDHFQAAIIDGKIYAAGGRTTSKATGEVFNLLVPKVDVYDLKTASWTTLDTPLPTPRAGNTSFAHKGKLYVVGGETFASKSAHSEVEIYDPISATWTTAEPLQRGRHGTGIGYARGYLWTASGSGNRGGSPELESTERKPVRK